MQYFCVYLCVSEAQNDYYKNCRKDLSVGQGCGNCDRLGRFCPTVSTTGGGHNEILTVPRCGSATGEENAPAEGHGSVPYTGRCNGCSPCTIPPDSLVLIVRLSPRRWLSCLLPLRFFYSHEKPCRQGRKQINLNKNNVNKYARRNYTKSELYPSF